MPRLRTIHPNDAHSDELAALPLSAAYTYAYLPTVLDDAGRAKDQPGVFNGILWPLRVEEHPTSAMIEDIQALVDAGLICRYEVDGKAYIHQPGWDRRQRIARPTPTRLPACPVHDRTVEDEFDEAVSRVTDQVQDFLENAATRMDEGKLREGAARIVEDLAFHVFASPDKAAEYGRRIRGFGRPGPAQPAADPADQAAAGGQDRG